MAQTLVEKAIRQRRHSTGVLVPLIEWYMQNPVEITSHSDVRWMAKLFAQTMKRERERKDNPVFSPSSLASCLRQVYFTRHHKELEIPPLHVPRLEPQGYFLHGSFLHFKWQYVLFKMTQAFDREDYELVVIERRIMSKRGDHGGTVDAVVIIEGEPYIVDFKGVNVRDFQNIVRGNIPGHYRLQLCDYMILANSSEEFKMDTGIRRIEKAILIAENKGGPDPKHPLALHEHIVHLDEGAQEVRIRLKELRTHEKARSIPAPECTKTTTLQFKACPFQRFCKKEVKRIESQDTEGQLSGKPIARRSDRSRRPGRR